MKVRNTSLTKIKVTASLDPGLVEVINGYIAQNKKPSRSQFIEDLLRHWYLEHKYREIEKQIEQYHLSLSEDEQEEDTQWVRIAAQGAHQLWNIR